MRKRKADIVVYRGDDDEAADSTALHIPQARTILISDNGRRAITTPASPQKVSSGSHAPPAVYEWRPPSSEALDDPFLDVGEAAGSEKADGNVKAKVAAKRYPTSDAPLREWSGHGTSIGFREVYLHEDLRREGRGDARFLKSCPSCPPNAVSRGEPIYRCDDCLGGLMECKACCVRSHQRLPLHRIKQWTGDFFQKTTLRALGLVIQLGHVDQHCVTPDPGHKDFTVIDTTGIHHVAVNFCRCEHRISARQQLLRMDWFPATVHYPQTCATVHVLRQFHIITLTGKLSAYEYYRALENLTDNTGVAVPKTRFKSFMRMVRQYRHLKIMKRGGRGNEKDGISTTALGQLAVVCPACPIPEINLPVGWESVPVQDRFLYMLIVAVDANFRLKNLFRSTEQKDPGLHTGLAYFVDDKPYKAHVMKFATQKDISTCSGFKSIAHADSKFHAGLRSTGVAMCVCARHEFIRPNSVGDLQKGERFCNIDYIVLSALVALGILLLFISYDIACQYRKKFDERMVELPEHLLLPENIAIQWGVPKAHNPAHKLECQAPYSLNLKEVGRTDGEAPERSWSESNLVANSTKEMGPGSRHDTLDDHFGHHNWKKTCGLGALLHNRLVVAIPEAKRQAALHTEFTESIDPEQITAWTTAIKEWEIDNSKPCPYVSQVARISQDQVRRELADAEEDAVARGTLQLHDTGPSACLAMGLMIEESQRRIVWESKQPDLSARQGTDIQQRRLLLHRQLKQFRELQAVYIPLGATKMMEFEESQKLLPEDKRVRRDIEHQRLWFPSDLEPDKRDHGCYTGLPEMEAKLRSAQCNDALERIRALQRARQSMLQFRNRQIRGQRKNTRAVASILRLEDKSKATAVKYCVARAALKALIGPGEWEKQLRVLKREDITAPDGSSVDIEDPTDDIGPSGKQKRPKTKKQASDAAKGLGQGKHAIGWIWTVGTPLGDGEDVLMNDALRIEWAKGRARSLRWGEEVRLLKEEMRRIKCTLDWKASWWDKRAAGWSELPLDVAEGVCAYALRQAQVQRTIKDSFTRLWDKPLTPPPTTEESGEDGPEPYVDPVLESIVESHEDD